MPQKAQGEYVKKTRVFSFVLIALSLLMLGACKKSKAEVEAALPSPNILAQDLLANLNQIDGAIADVISAREAKFASEEDIRILLVDALKVHAAVLTSCYVDTKGILKYLEPAQYQDSEGADISKQTHTIAMLEKPAPMISTAFKAVEGFATVAMAQPLLDAKGKFVGSLVLTIDTSMLPQLVLDKNGVSSDYEIWAMEPDGTIVCDADKEEIGLNLFTDSMYLDHEALQSLGKQIAASPKGEGEYSFAATGTDDVVAKKAAWETITMHGREWRVVLVKKG